LTPSGRERASVFSAHPKKHQLCHVSEVETDTAAIGTAILSDLVPHEVGFVGEAPSFHDGKSLG
jgi:hypothetical protein